MIPTCRDVKESKYCVRRRAELIHLEGRSTMCEYIKYTREHECRQVFTPLQKDTCVIANIGLLKCAHLHTRHIDSWAKMSSSLVPNKNRFSMLADPDMHIPTYTNTCDPCQRLQLLQRDSQVTNIFSPLCFLTLLSKERSGGGRRHDEKPADELPTGFLR